jgi:hypothetical protein
MLAALPPNVDGLREAYEYICYPARWQTLLENIKGLPATGGCARVTVQVYNALDLVEVFRFLDQASVPFDASLIQAPKHLAIGALPPLVRRLAAARLCAYAERDCQLRHRENVRRFAAELALLGDNWDPGLLREFLLFTHNLDSARGHRFKDSFPELWALIAATLGRGALTFEDHEILEAEMIREMLKPQGLSDRLIKDATEYIAWAEELRARHIELTKQDEQMDKDAERLTAWEKQLQEENARLERGMEQLKHDEAQLAEWAAQLQREKAELLEWAAQLRKTEAALIEQTAQFERDQAAINPDENPDR